MIFKQRVPEVLFPVNFEFIIYKFLVHLETDIFTGIKIDKKVIVFIGVFKLKKASAAGIDIFILVIFNMIRLYTDRQRLTVQIAIAEINDIVNKRIEPLQLGVIKTHPVGEPPLQHFRKIETKTGLYLCEIKIDILINILEVLTCPDSQTVGNILAQIIGL